jgi:hypothetical protein
LKVRGGDKLRGSQQDGFLRNLTIDRPNRLWAADISVPLKWTPILGPGA